MADTTLGSTTAGPIKNVIVMIADGAGANTIEATRLYLAGLPDGDPRGGAANAAGSGLLMTDKLGFLSTLQSVHPLDTRTVPGSDEQNPDVVYAPGSNYDATPVAGSVAAGYARAFAGYEWNRATYPDSANTASTISDGVKTYNNAVNVDGSGDSQFTTAELAHMLGKATGVVSTVQFSDATPAAGGGAHDISRANRTDIALEMFEAGILDVIAGTGNPDYDDNGALRATPDHSWVSPELWNALRNDTYASSDGGSWSLLQDRAAIVAAATGVPTAERLAMVPQAFTGTNFYRAGASPAGATEIPFSVPALATSPTLTELTAAALNKLGRDPEGFYVSIEGGSVDRAMHANNFGRMIEEYIDFNDAVQYVVNYVNSAESAATFEDTLLIVTADHDHLLFGPEGGSIAYQPVQPDRDGDGVPEYSWFSNNHSNQLVPLFVYGAGAQGVVAMADQVDSGTTAAGVAVGSGADYTDQAELGSYVLAQLALGDTRVSAGTAGRDFLQGTEGADVISAGAGDDIVLTGAGRDFVYGEAGFDTLDGGAGDDVLFGNAGSDILFGGEGDDLLNGDDGDGAGRGDLGADRLDGGAGDDVVEIGDGLDVVTGGEGRDTFGFKFSNPQSAAAAGTAAAFVTITDFDAADDRMSFDVVGVRESAAGANFADGSGGVAYGTASSFYSGAAAGAAGERVVVITDQAFASGALAVQAVAGEEAGDFVLYYNTTVNAGSLLVVSAPDAATSIARFTNVGSIEEFASIGFTANDFIFV